MVGDLIQLLEDTSKYELADAEAAYFRALGTDPTYAEGYTASGSSTTPCSTTLNGRSPSR
jgi:hypothetical protein